MEYADPVRLTPEEAQHLLAEVAKPVFCIFDNTGHMRRITPKGWYSSKQKAELDMRNGFFEFRIVESGLHVEEVL